MNASRNRPGTAAAGPDPKVIIGVIVGVIVLVAVSIAFVVSGDDGDDAAEYGAQYGIVTVQGDPLPVLPESGTDPAAGGVAPTVVSERSGEQIRLEPDAAGEPTMVVFLAHWCSHCQAELPLLVEMADDGAFDDIGTVAVLTETDEDAPNFPPAAWLDDEGWTGVRLFDDESSAAAQAYGLSSFPFMVFLDEDGRVVQRLEGEQPRETVEAAVDAIS